MTNALLNIHVIIAQIISCILCAILIFIVFSQIIYYLCIYKFLHSFYTKDESNLSRFQFPNENKTSKSSVPDTHKYDDIHSFFRVTTTVSLLFCLVASICSTISITDLLVTGALSHHTKYIRFTCFVSWLFSHYSMSSVFVGRLYVSFKDSIFQYSIHIIRILSVSLAALPLLLVVSLLFWIMKNNDMSLVFFISFIAMDVAFSIVLTSLFIHKLYQLIKGRIMTRNEPPNRSSASSVTLHVKSDAKPSDAQCASKTNDPSQPTVITAETSKKEDIDPCAPITPQVKIEIPVITFAMPDFASHHPPTDDPKAIMPSSPDGTPSYVPHTETTVKEETPVAIQLPHTAAKADKPVPRRTVTFTEIMDDDMTVLPVDTPVAADRVGTPVAVDYDELDIPVSIKGTVTISDKPIDTYTPRSTNSPKTVRFSNTTSKMATSEADGSRAKRYIHRARSLSRSLSKSIKSPRHSMAFIRAKKKLDQQQLQLIDNMTRHGLLLFLSSITSLTCLIYIMFTFQHYETIDDYSGADDGINTVYYYLYWNMGIGAFLNGLSLYLSFAFAQWFYKKLCNKVHKWLEAVCVILIVKQLKQNNPDISTVPV